MPATEQTWRDTKLLHVVFGLSGLAMLVTTLWMMAADHNREWKQYQRKFRDVESWTTVARIDEQKSDEYAQRERELERRLTAARANVPSQVLVTRFITDARGRETANRYRLGRIEARYEALRQAAADHRAAADGAAEQRQTLQRLLDSRDELVAALDQVVKQARFDEDNRQRELKFERADLDVARSRYDLAVGEGRPPSELQAAQREVKSVQDRVDDLTLAYQDAQTHRERLQTVVDRITAEQVEAHKALETHQTELARLQTALDERRSNPGKRLLELPIVDAFGRPLKPDQIWLPQLTINNNFRDVARVDRCTTCHQGIDKTAAGSAVEPLYKPTERLTLSMGTPEEAPSDAAQPGDARLLEQVYGIQLAGEGLIDPNDVTISVVRPRSLAARALLEAGDVLERIGDVKVLDKDRAYTYLLESVRWGQPLELHVRRGVPHPYSSHPRLDLFVGSMSPHKIGDVGCTICHEGQGTATAFKWASHTPNDPGGMRQWKRDHGWFNNHHWIFPMLPERFSESSCLKCHHDVAELEPSERFPDPPAPKLMAGHHIIRQYGCFGCHEINGYDSPDKRRGPDLRAEPPYYAAAAQLLIDPGLDDRQRELALEVIEHPEQTATRKLLAESIRQDAGLADSTEELADSTEETPKLSQSSHELAAILGADDETPGQLRKVGPSLRHLASKADFDFVYNWIRDPTDFRPNTRMPKFFGLNEHLAPEPKLDERGNPVRAPGGHVVMEPSPGLEDSQKFEPIEIRAAAQYLLHYSQPFEYVDLPQNGSGQPSAERGKELFQVRGCLACHQHKDFPEITATQGPDLSRIGAKLTTDAGARWLYSWVREPNRYHARTVMPNVFLEPITHRDGAVTDPADDITAYLLASQGWRPKPVPALDATARQALDELAVMYLEGSFTKKQSREYVDSGIPQSLRADIKGDELELVRDDEMTPQRLLDKKLLYVGRRTISRLGCAGCHDIPGFESSKPIGTGLADWGRKETSKLAFEQIVPFLERNPPDGASLHASALGMAHGGDDASPHGGGHDASFSHGHLDPAEMPADTGFFVSALLDHQREGFLWQKLRQPRSYDYKKTENKTYIERLRMPKFNLDEEQIESVMTFVLGLVSEPPAARYVYQPKPRRKAILDGEQVIARFNCDGCHTLRMDTWEFEYDPDEFADPPEFNDHAFLMPHFSPQELAESAQVDRRGMGRSVITGVPNPDVQEDDDGLPLHFFAPWQPVAINGKPWLVGGPEVPVSESQILAKRLPEGGDFARYLHPIAVEMGQRDNPNVKPGDVWGWVPPPLVREGAKVQTSWLHDFLLNPVALRPAALLRMPKFNMSPDEASKLVNYFAAVDNARYPYEYHPRSNGDYLGEEQLERLGHAMNLITNKTYCVKCHLIGDFIPEGTPDAWAPNLDRMYQRMRPDYLHEWLANPQRKLPYTGMPVNFPPHNDPNEAIRSSLFPGSTREALEGVVDLLLNYDAFINSRTSIKPLVTEAPQPADQAPPGRAASAGGQ